MLSTETSIVACAKSLSSVGSFGSTARASRKSATAFGNSFCARVTAPGILLEELANDRLEPFRDRALAELPRLGVQDGVRDGDGGAPLERQPSRDHLVE